MFTTVFCGFEPWSAMAAASTQFPGYCWFAVGLSLRLPWFIWLMLCSINVRFTKSRQMFCFGLAVSCTSIDISGWQGKYYYYWNHGVYGLGLQWQRVSAHGQFVVGSGSLYWALTVQRPVQY
jgi:hypothetical protein